MSRRRSAPTARNLDRLDTGERSLVLSELLAAHPELVAEAEDLAMRLLTIVSTDAVADDVIAALTSLDMDDLANRAGRHRGGYVEANEAAWALIEEAFEPFLDDVRRLAELGHIDAAIATARGVLAGLDQLGEPMDGTVLAWSGPDTLDHLADALRLVAERLGTPIDGHEQTSG